MSDESASDPAAYNAAYFQRNKARLNADARERRKLRRQPGSVDEKAQFLALLATAMTKRDIDRYDLSEFESCLRAEGAIAALSFLRREPDEVVNLGPLAVRVAEVRELLELGYAVRYRTT